MEHKSIEKNIDIDLSKISKLDIFDSPLGKGRKDRGVIITDSNGKTMRTSNIMLGRQNVEFNNGIYLSLEEIKKALKDYLVEIEKDNKEVISKRTKKKVKSEELLNELKKMLNNSIEKIKLDGKVSNIKNQDSSSLKLKGKNETDYLHKASLMLGNRGIKLSNGEYIEESEIKKALNNYIIKKASPPKQNKIYTVKRTKKKYPLLTLLIPIIMAATLGLNSVQAESVKNIPEINEAIVKVQSGYNKEISNSEALQSAFATLNTGDSIIMEKGIQYHESSDYNYGGENKTGKFGDGLRETGNYKLDYISIINKKTGDIIKVENNKNQNIGEFINKTLDQNNLNFSDVEVMIHIGGPVSGWVNAKDLTNLIENTKESNTIFKIDKEYNVIEKNFTGIITITLDNGSKVDLNIIDKDGNLLPKNTIIIGSDGKEYRLNEINIEKQDNQQQIITSKVWEISKEKALVGGIIGSGIATLAAATYAELTKKEEKRRITEKEYNESLKKYKKNSRWEKLKLILPKLKNKFSITTNKLKLPNIESEKEIYEIIENNNKKR